MFSVKFGARRSSPRHLVVLCLLCAALFCSLHREQLGLYRDKFVSVSLSNYAATLARAPAAPPEKKGLTVVTLAYRVPYDRARVGHNCRMISGTHHRFLIYTDDMSAPFCRLCECRRFEPANCPPPNRRPKSVNHCEKLAFVARMVPRLREMVFLDSDLVVMKRYFLDQLQSRSKAHDFLANYDQSGYRHPPKHYTFFNSGMFFMRFLPTANYSDMLPRMYKYRTGFDQSILTGWVFDNIKNWDTFSWKWHCRAVLRTKQDTPLNACYTIHDRYEESRLLKKLNFTLLTVP